MFYLVFLRLINWIIELESEILFYTKYYFLAIDIFYIFFFFNNICTNKYVYIFKLIKKSQKQKENEECTVEG